MRLASVEVIPYALPFKEPYVTANGTLTQREMVLLRLRTDEGIVGLGEAVPLSLRGGVALGQVVEELRDVAASEALHDFFGRASFEVHSVGEIDPRLELSAPVRSAVLAAVEDFYERLLDIEEPKLGLREIQRKPIACNATLSAGPPSKVAEDALAWAAEGFSTFKLKLGAGDDVAQVRAVREAVGPTARVRVDANGSWSLETAIELLAEIEPYGIELVEQPVATMKEAAALTQTTAIPLSGDESIANRAEAELAIEEGAFRMTGIKLSKVGGFFTGMEIAETMPAYVSSALDGPVGIAIGAHLAYALDRDDFSHPGEPPRAHGLATQRLFASTIAAVECELRDGFLHRPPGPGLGVEIDEDALQAHRL
ncbi:MAG TPA: mandelate racemase/muconate lactonizing enzyme family protein [Solirubrobacterales bacterium]|nr:mandelate racemase/muconate lactonizing enzyme family protein [Solirubrobacterales bacterium]